MGLVDEPVFFIDVAAVIATQVAEEGFWIPDPLHTAVSLNILDELIDAL